VLRTGERILSNDVRTGTDRMQHGAPQQNYSELLDIADVEFEQEKEDGFDKKARFASTQKEDM